MVRRRESFSCQPNRRCGVAVEVVVLVMLELADPIEVITTCTSGPKTDQISTEFAGFRILLY